MPPDDFHQEQGELVVDTEGRLSLIGDSVSLQLRGREGAYHLLVGAEGLLVFRRAGDDDQDAGRRIILSGEIGGTLGAVEVINLVASAHLRGELIIRGADVQRSIFLEAGIIRMASSNAPNERLGKILSRLGLVSEDALEAAIREVSAERRLGEILVEHGICTKTDLYALLQRQVEEIIYAATLVRTGSFVFVDGFESEQWPAQVHVPAQALLLESVRRMDEMAVFRQRIPSAQMIPVPVTPAKSAASLDEEARAMLALCDGKRNIDDLARVSARGEFDATRLVFHLLQKKYVELRNASPIEEDARIVELVDGFNDVLEEIFRTTSSTGRADETREFLGTFLDGWGSYRGLYEGAGPDESGRFDRERIIENLKTSDGASSRELLYQAFNEYLCFALFAAGSVLPRDEEKKLSKRIEDLLGRIRTA